MGWQVPQMMRETAGYPKYSAIEKQVSQNQEAAAGKVETEQQSMTKGIIFILVSCVTIILMQITVKNLTRHFSAFLVLGVRGSLLFLFNSIFILRRGLDYNIRDPSSICLHIRSISTVGLSIHFELSRRHSLPGVIEVPAHRSSEYFV